MTTRRGNGNGQGSSYLAGDDTFLTTARISMLPKLGSQQAFWTLISIWDVPMLRGSSSEAIVQLTTILASTFSKGLLPSFQRHSTKTSPRSGRAQKLAGHPKKLSKLFYFTFSSFQTQKRSYPPHFVNYFPDFKSKTSKSKTSKSKSAFEVCEIKVLNFKLFMLDYFSSVQFKEPVLWCCYLL